MLRFIGNTISMFLLLIFIAIPLSLLTTCLLIGFLMLCASLAGIIGVFLGIILSMAMFFASMIH